ncbi:MULTISPECIES: hypothetical protein [Microbacterium]|uniref:hypothetical protein n=1 Tax=Microbacterium TaxID=33882 RepID=UPI00146B024B|nr:MULTISPECIES: hypothetical protein [Microbacterium]
MGKRGVAVLAMIAALLLVMVAIALAVLFTRDAQASGRPAPPPTEPATIATPTVETVIEPTVPLGGDCTQVLTATQLDGLLGAGWMPEAQYRDTWNGPTLPSMREVSLGTLGGLECQWYSADGTVGDLGVVILPVAQVPPAFAAAYAEERCDPSYDALGCRIGKRSGDYWIMTRAYRSSEDMPEGFLARAADEAAATVGDRFDGVAADRQETWATLPACDALAEAMRLEKSLGSGYVNGYWEGVEQPEEAMLTTAGVGLTCPWFSVDGSAPGGRSFIVTGTVGAGASWAWDRLAATEGAVPVPVDGAVSAVTFEVANDRVWLYATDGANVVELTNATTSDLVPIAERMLSVLAG